MDKSALVDSYVSYMIKVGRTTDAEDENIPTDELDVALDACSFYTDWEPFICFDGEEDEEITLELTSPSYLISPRFGIKSISELTIDGNVLDSQFYHLCNPDGKGLRFQIKLDQSNYQINDASVIEATGFFGKLLNLSKFESTLLFQLANALAGKDTGFNIFMQDPDITKMTSGSQSVTYNRNSLSSDNILKIFSYFGQFKTILLKYKRYRFL